jgi:uncharacterized protein
MHVRRFGRTNLYLSVFSLGTMRFLASEENALQTITKAVELGVNHIETARGYGNSERFLGSALRTLPRHQLYITSKIPPTLDRDSMARSLDQSLAALGVDYIDCFAVHGINTWEHLAWIENPNGCMQAVQRAVADGHIRHVGFSTHAPLEIVLRTIATDQFEFVNLHYYFFNQRHAPAIAAAHQQDMGIFIISPADKGGMLFAPPSTLEELCHPFTPLELTYRFLLSDPRITTLSVGAANPGELDALVPVCDRTEALTEDEATALGRLMAQSATVLQTDLCHQCYECLPCPESIQIPEVLRLRNLAIAYDMTSFGQYRYRMFENAGHWFPGNKANRCTDCGDCLPRCPLNLEIPRLLRDTHDRLNGDPRRRLWE